MFGIQAPGLNMQMGFGSDLFSRSLGMMGGFGMSASMSIGGLSMSMGISMGMGMDTSSLSPEAMMGGQSSFMHPLISGGFGLPQCGYGYGMGMVPGMMGAMGGMQNQNQTQMLMMMQLMMMIMQLLQMMQAMGMGNGMMGSSTGIGMPNVGVPCLGMPNSGIPGFGNPMGMTMPGGFGSPIGMCSPGFGSSAGFGCPLSMSMPSGVGISGGFGISGGVGVSSGFGSPVGIRPYDSQETDGTHHYSDGRHETQGMDGANQIPNQQGGAGMGKWIDNYLAQRGSPAAGKGAGNLFVKYGKQYNVDPMVLLAISQHETNHGKLGVGIRKMLGVGAFDANPSGRTKFDGMENQIRCGASTFDKLRKAGGSNPDDPIAKQIAAVGRAGWASDSKWSSKVLEHYKQITRDARAGGAYDSPSGSKTTSIAEGGGNQKLANYAASWDGKNFKPGQTKRCADFVSTMIENSGSAPQGFKHQTSCDELQKYGTHVGKDQLKPGDIVFFRDTYRNGDYTHTGIFLGNGKFVHRPTADKPVRVDNLNSGYYAEHFSGGRRLQTI